MLTGEQILDKLKAVNWPEYGKKSAPRVVEEDECRPCWKKKLIFFELEYWKHHYVRHNLDVMHIEKNVCDRIIGTLLNIPRKTKDGAAARLDILEMGIRTYLLPTKEGKRTRLPSASWNLLKDEKRSLCKYFYGMKVPEGYSSNVRSLVSMEDQKLIGLKSHDCHTLMQQLLSVSIRGVLDKAVRDAITRYCIFCNALCNKVVDGSRLLKIQELVVTLCLLEKYFPPSFFDIMIHVTVHLIRELQLCGPVYFRWMYPFERFMKVLKGYVRNRNRPEGCMIDSYISEEAIEVCTEHMPNVKTVGIPKYHIMGCSTDCKPLSGATIESVNREQLEQAHLYVLENTDEMEPYIGEHMLHVKNLHPKHQKDVKWLRIEHNKTFIEWFRKRVAHELACEANEISKTLRWLADGPSLEVLKYKSYKINGVNFNTKARDDIRAVQNSGVHVVANTMQVASSKDKNPVITDMGYYGVIQEIWNLDYVKFVRTIFKCDWVENKKGIRFDDFGFTLVDLHIS